MSKNPQESKMKDIFYLKPKAVTPKDPLGPFYTSVPMGKNTLFNMMKKMAKDAGLDHQVSNHSL